MNEYVFLFLYQLHIEVKRVQSVIRIDINFTTKIIILGKYKKDAVQGNDREKRIKRRCQTEYAAKCGITNQMHA